ncbi:MAG TPA: protein translocase subunit SecD [Bryobacterales bacterium]|nr:protein translocase subunit SecD [Bryobacterales bacterium]
MTGSLRNRLLVTLAVTIVSIIGIIGFPTSLDDVMSNVRERIPLGLDLKGGVHLILQVQVQDALRAETDRTIRRLEEELGRAATPITSASMQRNNPTTIEEADDILITVEGVPAERAADFRNIVDQYFPDWLATSRASTTWELRLRPASLARIKSDTVNQSIATVENRVNALGLSEPTIQQHGRADAEYEILVQLPGLTDPARVLQMISMTAQLGIHEVIDPTPYPNIDAARSAHSGTLPPNSEIRPFQSPGVAGAENQWYILNAVPVVMGSDLRNAIPGRSPTDQTWQAEFFLSPEAGARFGDYTGANVGNALAVVLDDRIRSVATIRERIADSGSISGLSGQQEAIDLTVVLKAGALPASVEVLEERTVGASLGADSIRQGVRSALVGLLLIVVAMLVYYRKAGINAVVALLLNLLILLAVLGYFGFVLTLPGIAGIVLTIGMAVDANVLIFERIREELSAGKGVVGALNAGFAKALLTIIDTNLTTIIAAAFLFLFGRGPVRGFAVTLAVGLVANLFTSVFVSRTMFDLGLSGKKQVKEFSI